ncbi:MAG: DUF2842 domain-containing protein, partial [Candidatus Puniceispirillum sp.]
MLHFFSSISTLGLMVQRWRHLVVAIGLVPALILYVGAVMQIADRIADVHVLVDLVFYV